jgi:hypothetical protein
VWSRFWRSDENGIHGMTSILKVFTAFGVSACIVLVIIGVLGLIFLIGAGLIFYVWLPVWNWIYSWGGWMAQIVFVGSLIIFPKVYFEIFD